MENSADNVIGARMEKADLTFAVRIPAGLAKEKLDRINEPTIVGSLMKQRIKQGHLYISEWGKERNEPVYNIGTLCDGEVLCVSFDTRDQHGIFHRYILCLNEESTKTFKVVVDANNGV